LPLVDRLSAEEEKRQSITLKERKRQEKK
jgi:hypothetical protein